MIANRIIQVIKLLFLLLVIFIIFEITNIDNKYINKPPITIDLNNIRNPQVKKILRFLDNYLGHYYFKFSKEKQKEFNNIDIELYKNLPDRIKINNNEEKFTLSINKNYNNLDNWPRSHGNHSSNKFSELKKINLSNIKNLDLAWTYTFNKKKPVPGNAIYYNNRIFVSSTENSLISLDAKTGKKIWEHKTEGSAAVRGLLINPKNKHIYFCDQKNLISLNSDKGVLNKNFSKNGKIKLKHKCQTTPVIIENNLIIATFEPGIEVYDLESGEIKWKFYLKEKSNYFRYGGKRYDYSGGNPWGGISADVDRQIVYVSTGNAGRFHEGTTRPGANKYSNSIVAIDIKNKKFLWAFQEIEHDIWNYDIASPPILTSIKKNNKKIDVVVVPTKYGNTLVLDRLTGRSLFDYEKIKVPQSKVPGEKTAFYQKKFTLPEPFSRKTFKLDDVSNLFPETKKFILNKIKGATFGFFIPNSIDKKNIIYKGGAQWMGASVDHESSTMFVNSSNIPSFIWIDQINTKNTYYRYRSRFSIIKDQYGYPGTKPPWGNLTSIDLNTGKINWQVPFGEYEELTKKGISKTGTINYGGVVATSGNIIFATGTLDNKLTVFNSMTGEEVWSYKMKYAGSSPPTVYSVDNEQYVLVVATGSYTPKSQFPKHTEFGDKIYVFKLKK
jgi:glucose dehydrogenase